jgi:putative phosphoesterase
MLIGILSDTHIIDIVKGYRLAEELLEGPFAAVSAIIHAGDHVHPDLNCCFGSLPFYSVCGNMDEATQERPLKRILSVAGKRIGVVHGWGNLGTIEQRVLQTFAADGVDVIVFGHSHRPLCKQVGSVLLLNPGSATDRRSAPFHSVALLNVAVEVTAEIISLDSFPD